MSASASAILPSDIGRRQGASILTDQAIAGVIMAELEQKKLTLAQDLELISREAAADSQTALSQLNEALGYVERVRDFAAPQNLNSVLGSMSSKHGEIAEQMEVQIRNARAVFDGLRPVADIDSVARTAPEDYLINGAPVQSKFVAGFNKCLDHVLDHMNKYPDFAKDATAIGYPGKAGSYIIPKDHYETITKILHGNTTEYNPKTIQACKNFIQEIEAKTGRSFFDVVQPSISKYGDVQLGTVDRTLDAHEGGFREETDARLDKIGSDARENAEQARKAAEPGLGDALQAGLAGAAMGGAITGALSIYKKMKGGTPLTQFSVQDWKEVGIDFGKGAARGGISGLGIFSLTQLGGFSAPFAGAMVSTGIGITSLLMDYRAGRISREDFADAACSLGVESGLTAVGTALGTALIPVPVVGSVVGAMAARAAILVTKTIAGDKDRQLIQLLEKQYNEIVAALNAEQQKALALINAWYARMDGLLAAAMDKDVNMRLFASVALCRHVGVPEDEILHDLDEIEAFMRS